MGDEADRRGQAGDRQALENRLDDDVPGVVGALDRDLRAIDLEAGGGEEVEGDLLCVLLARQVLGGRLGLARALLDGAAGVLVRDALDPGGWPDHGGDGRLGGAAGGGGRNSPRLNSSP